MGRHWSRESTVTQYTAKTDADEVYKLSHAPQFKSSKQFIQAKLVMLLNDFCITPTETEIKHLYDIATESQIKNWSQSKTEEAINRAVRQIINNHW